MNEEYQKTLGPIMDMITMHLRNLYIEIMSNSEMSNDDFKEIVDCLSEITIHQCSDIYLEHINGIRRSLGLKEIQEVFEE